MATESAVGNRLLFTGREFEAETGLYFYRARYYSPGMGRFLNRDPAGYVDGLNLYAYVQNNPIIRTDPAGLNWFTELFTGGFETARDDFELAKGYWKDGGVGGVAAAAGIGALGVVAAIDQIVTDIPVIGTVKGMVENGIKAGGRAAIRGLVEGEARQVGKALVEDEAQNLAKTGARELAEGEAGALAKEARESATKAATEGTEKAGTQAAKEADGATIRKGPPEGTGTGGGGGGGSGKPISMDEAVERGASHVEGRGVMETTGKDTNFQFRSATTAPDGTVKQKIARFDVNPADPHVQKSGPHLNIEVHENGKSVSNVHIPIDPTTVRPGDIP